ncbi:hypothetical protein BDV18DRAFT_91042 [Aspergillus unguis]
MGARLVIHTYVSLLCFKLFFWFSPLSSRFFSIPISYISLRGMYYYSQLFLSLTMSCSI